MLHLGGSIASGRSHLDFDLPAYADSLTPPAERTTC
jgi:hypothetical protein